MDKRVEVIKGIKAIRFALINSVLMDVNGYYYWRPRACSGEQLLLVYLLRGGRFVAEKLLRWPCLLLLPRPA